MIRGLLIFCLVLTALPALAQEVGDTRRVTMDDVLAADDFRNRSAPPVRKVTAPADAVPSVPEGFEVQAFVDDLISPTAIAIQEGGDVFVTDQTRGRIMRIRDRNGDGRSDISSTYLVGFEQPSGLLIDGDTLYISDISGLWRLIAGQGLVADSAPELIANFSHLKGLADAPRPLALADDGETIYVGLPTSEPRGNSEKHQGSIAAYNLTTQTADVIATGLRAPTALAVSPVGDLWTAVEEAADPARDYVAKVIPGAFYGWPLAFGDKHPHPELGRRNPYKAASMTPPDIMLERGAGPLGMVFVPSEGFPENLHGEALVSLGGSAADGRGGFSIITLSFQHGRVSPEYKVFTSGFRDESGDRAWGRPSAMTFSKDGVLYVSDTWSGAIWRFEYTAPPLRR